MNFKAYKVNYMHRQNINQKSRWTISECDELKIFVDGLLANWSNNNDTIWSIKSLNSTPVCIGEESPSNKNKGSKNENLYIAKFVKDNNDEWHGYPISCYSNNDSIIPSKITSDWNIKGLFPKNLMSKWMKGKL